MSTETESVREAARRARMILHRLSSEGGLLHQIETGEWDDRLNGASSELGPLLEVIAERARLDRIVIERFSHGG